MSRSFYLTSTSSLYSTLLGEFTPSVTTTSSQYIDLDLCLAFSFDNSNWFQEVCTISSGNVGKSGFSKSFDQRSISGEFLAEEEQETTFNVSPGEEIEDAVWKTRIIVTTKPYRCILCNVFLSNKSLPFNIYIGWVSH